MTDPNFASTLAANDVGRHRARMKFGRRRKRSPSVEPRKASAVLTMVDLLSCAFGGAIFLFLLTAEPPGNADASPKAATDDGLLTIRMASTIIRPIFVLRQKITGQTFIVDGATLTGHSAQRKIAKSRSGLTGGSVFAIGSTPWDAEPGGQLHELTLKFEKPTTDWCIRYGTASDDSSARARSIDQVKGPPIQIVVQGPRARRAEVKLGQPDEVLPALQMSPCYDFKFS